jgi:tetratricopeptide (TPR) repeat protein
VRNAYKDLTGSAPPKDWGWERLARELFRLHDAARLRVVYEQMAAGADAAKAERYDDAVAAFNDVLSRVPLFDRRGEMTPAYFERAKQLIEKGERERALLLLHKALRLDPKTPHQAAIESRIAMLEGERLIENGTPDRFILERALRLDPNNERARKALDAIEQAGATRQKGVKRYLAALGIGVLALVLMVLVARVPGRQTKDGGHSENDRRQMTSQEQPPG